MKRSDEDVCATCDHTWAWHQKHHPRHRFELKTPDTRAQHEAQLKQLNANALVAIGFDEKTAAKASPPTIAIHFGLVGHGYEIHTFEDGKYLNAVSRDFSGNHKVKKLKESLIDAIETAIKNWRSKL